MVNKFGHRGKRIEIKVLYRGEWYKTSSLMIEEDGQINVENCHGLYGSVDSEHIEDVKIRILK